MPVFGHKNLEDIRTLHIVTCINDLSKPEARKDGKSGAFTRHYSVHSSCT
ncbi:hypothetical protein P7H15_10900 [Paenibacillus larvae]|nr:hypothetical protein [Paenibacillus larvae]